ncbi:SusC/RagA family TonB-linked outer membrane protein [Flavihumibacter sp. R14]|nr:SusC/RagA family TonB-linked outer membrane protein [Flavihumibacter soli]
MNLKILLSRFFYGMLFFLISSSAYAQNKAISGTVTDSKDGQPLIGVSVAVKGTATGTTTGADGTYRLSVPATTSALVFTYLGYNMQEITIGDRTTINVAMQSSSTALTEVVVVGYGTQKLKDATGSVSSLGEKDFNKGVIATPEQLLQGRVSGVTVTPSSGEPGAGATINIRGSGSIRAGNGPLYVVDGVPLDGGGTSGGFDNGGEVAAARNPLAFINPSDIENISILKDASASAIYGSRGANGVVLITTKTGGGNQGIQFGALTSVSTIAKRYDLLSPGAFLPAVAATGADASAVDFGGNTDWQDEILRTGVSQNFNLGFGGANKGLTYRASFGYDNQNGTVKSSSLQRFTGRINAAQLLLKDKLKLEVQFTASNIQNDYAPITDNAGFQGSLIGAVLQANPTVPVKNADGTYGTPGGGFRNPVSMLEIIYDDDNINRYLGNFGASYTFAKNFTYRGSFGFDNSDSKRETFYDPRLNGYNDGQSIRGLNISNVSGNGRGVTQNLKLASHLTEHTLIYDRAFTENTTLNVLGGYSYQQFKNNPLNEVAWTTQTPNVLVQDMSAFQNRTPLFGDSTKSELQSFFGRAKLNLHDKYLITGTVRVDGSSKFGENNKYATFPAFAVRWKIMNEDFAPKDMFDDLSLRLNYGITGNQEFPAYASLAIKQANFNGSTTTITAASPDLKWETTTQYGFGIDFAILKNKLSGTLDYFNKSTEDLLFLQDYAQPAAIPRRWVNLPGKVINSGVEVGLNFDAVRKDKFTWDLQYNMTFLDNEVKDFGNRNVITGNIHGQGLSGAYSQVITNGAALASFNVPIFGGYDANGLGIYPNGDLGSIVGSAIPTFTAGLTNNFTFGKFNANFFLNAATGFFLYNNTANAYFLKGNLATGRNVTTDVANSIENALNSGEVSTRFVEKGDFLRLSNVNLGYTFDVSNMKTFKSLRLSVSGQNLFVITDYSGLDPEINTNKERNGVPSRGIDYTAYPTARTFSFGINAGF